MKYVVFVPGIMGTRLATPGGDEVWPPTIFELKFGYRRIAELMDPGLVTGDIIREVACFDVYEPIIDIFAEMGFRETGGGDRLSVFAYDWRRDLELLAERMAAHIEALPAAATSIDIVAHSMGGLIARLLLESGKYAARPWFAKITGLITIGTPHRGAPLALARILGLDSAMGVAAKDFALMAGDRRYPSGYQLLPAPGEQACWDVKPGSPLPDIDFYTPAGAAALGLDFELVKRAAWVHETFAAGSVPAHVRYFYFGGTGHETVTRVNIGQAARQPTRSRDAGDGTVPLWSALPVNGQKQLVVGEHMSFFGEDNFRPVFFRLFGKPGPTPVTVKRIDGIDVPTASLSVQSVVLTRDRKIEVLIVPAVPLAHIEGSLVLERTEDPATPFTAFRPPVPVHYEGPELPSVRLSLPPTGLNGLYRLSFVGAPHVGRPAQFAVTDV